MTAFNDHVLKWLQTLDEKPQAISVTSVTGWGTDYAGDTAGGFYDEFDVSIEWIDARGKKHFDEVDGARMGSLWKWVVQAWPGEAER